MAPAVTRVVHRCEDAQETQNLGTHFAITAFPLPTINTNPNYSSPDRENIRVNGYLL